MIVYEEKNKFKKGTYDTRKSCESQYFKCVEENIDQLEGVWDERFAQTHGFWRGHVKKVINHYFDCGDLHYGFALIKCEDCDSEFLLPFSCKKRYFCPSCHQKRVIEFGEYLTEEIIEKVPHRQWVFSIPKRLRIFFKYDRKLLGKLSKCASDTMSEHLSEDVRAKNREIDEDEKLSSGIVSSIQTYGDFINFNPHAHIIGTAGCYDSNNNFFKSVDIRITEIENDFGKRVLKMLKKEGKITQEDIENMDSWKHSGFNVYLGKVIDEDDTESMGNLARYLIRAPISQERMKYISKKDSKDGEGKVIYRSKDGKSTEIIPALEFLARLITHIPNKGEQLVRYCGYYSNKSRGIRKKENGDETKKPMAKNESGSKKVFKRNWARLIQKIYNVDPLKCPKCNGQMKVKGFIEDEATIKKVLTKLNLWNVKNIEPPDKDDAYVRKNKKLSDIECASTIDYENENEIYWNDKDADEILKFDLYQMSEAADILPNYEDEIDPLPNYDEYF